MLNLLNKGPKGAERRGSDERVPPTLELTAVEVAPETPAADPSPPEAEPAQAPSVNRDAVVPEINDPGSGRTIRITGRIITAPGAELELPPAVRDLCLLTDTGQFIVSKSHRHGKHVLSFEARAKNLGHRVQEPTLVDYTTVKFIYESLTKRGSAATAQGGRDSTRMQRDVIELIARAAQENASDLDIVVNADTAKVRMTIDGLLSEIDQLQPKYAEELLATAFAMADASDASYQPLEYQGARISRLTTELPPGVEAVRLQWNPTVNNGRFLAARLLYSVRKNLSDIDTLGYSRGHLNLFKYMRAMPIGMNIISGPTGAGKSTTLMVALTNLIRERNQEINVLTVEDPPEYVIDGAIQMPVTNAKTPEERALKFHQAIIAALRSHPNALMIGEIRDRESGALACQGAMTGHQIWASLHANNALAIIDRLRDMGVEDYKLFDPTIMTGLIGQRLLRVLCPYCKQPLDAAVAGGRADEAVAERARTMLKKFNRSVELFHRGPGCEHCKKGYTGRTVAAEIVLPDQQLMDYLQEGRKKQARDYWLADLKGATMLAHALTKMMAGDVSPADVEANVGVLAYEPFMNRIFVDREDEVVR